MFGKKPKQEADFEVIQNKQAKTLQKLNTKHRSLCDYIEHLKRGGDKPIRSNMRLL